MYSDLERRVLITMRSSYDKVKRTCITDEQRKIALARHRLDYETYMVVAPVARRSEPDIPGDLLWLSAPDNIEKTLPASQHMPHLLKKKESSNNRSFAAELQRALERFFRCDHPLLSTMARCATRHMYRMDHIFDWPRVYSKSIVWDALRIAVSSREEDGSVIFGGRRYEIGHPSSDWQFLMDKQATSYEPEVLGLVGGTEVSCLPDKGAGCNFMSLQHAERHGIPVIPPDPDSKITRLGNGKEVEIAGHATLPFSFKGEAESHQLKFVVLPRCIKDVILGSPFLRLTKLFEHHAHRIVRKIRTFPGARACYTASQERVVGILDGELVHALPDTGSDVMLISETYARRRGLSIDQSTHYCFPLTFADGSQSWTSGTAKDVPWEYGTDGGMSTLCDFYVLPDLQCDVLLSYDFLHLTDAFSLHERWMSSLDEPEDSENRAHSEWLLSTITRNSAPSSDSDSYLKRLRRKLHSGGGGGGGEEEQEQEQEENIPTQQ